MTGQLHGKVALVTGASSGIGAATAATLLDSGARVVATARRIERLHAFGRARGVGEDRFLALEADVRDDADVAAIVAGALDWGGRIDILVNNAGLSRGNLHEGSVPEDMRLILDTNVYALANLTRLAIPAIRQAKGDIVNIASTAAISLIPGTAVYAASKAAVAAFSEVLRKELCSDGVRVLTVYPGLVETEFFDGFDAEKKTRLVEMAQSIEALKDQDLADLIHFALTRPPHVSLNEIVIRPTRQP